MRAHSVRRETGFVDHPMLCLSPKAKKAQDRENDDNEPNYVYDAMHVIFLLEGGGNAQSRLMFHTRASNSDEDGLRDVRRKPRAVPTISNIGTIGRRWC